MVTRGQQTLFLRRHDSFDPFEWGGKGAALGAVSAAVGDLGLRAGQFDPAALFALPPDIEVEAGPRPITAEVRVPKEVRASLIEDWLDCRWDVDVRFQECGRRDIRTNWTSIMRLCRARFQAYGSDGDEVVTSSADDGVLLIRSGLVAPWPLEHLWRLTASVLPYMPTEDFTTIAVCEQKQCADAVGRARACTVRVGTTGFYGHPQVHTSIDFGATWDVEELAGWVGDVDGLDCRGELVVAASALDHAVMWDDGVAGWTEVGLAGSPRAVRIYDPGLIVVVGESGYVWRSVDTARTFTLVDAGATVSENLYGVQPVNRRVWWAWGDDNALIRSVDGAVTWDVVVGPVLQTGVDVTALCLLDEDRALVGYADGELWYAEDAMGAAPAWVRDVSVVAFAQINAIVSCGCGRVMLAGYDAGGNGLVYESVDSGAPGTWEAVQVPAAMGGIADMVCCGVNDWLAVGSGVYLSGAIGQILRMR